MRKACAGCPGGICYCIGAQSPVQKVTFGYPTYPLKYYHTITTSDWIGFGKKPETKEELEMTKEEIEKQIAELEGKLEGIKGFSTRIFVGPTDDDFIDIGTGEGVSLSLSKFRWGHGPSSINQLVGIDKAKCIIRALQKCVDWLESK